MYLPFQMCFYLFVVIVVMNFTRKCRADLDDSRSCRWFLTDRCTHWTLFLRHRKVRINTDWLQFNSVTLFRATHRVQCDILCCFLIKGSCDLSQRTRRKKRLSAKESDLKM